MEGRRWFYAGLPQTLQNAVVLLYLSSALLLIQGAIFGGLGLIGLAFVVGQVAGAFGISNERKWGFLAAVVFAVLPLAFVVYLMVRYDVLAFSVISLLFQIVLVVLLLHPQSREYRRIWFR